MSYEEQLGQALVKAATVLPPGYCLELRIERGTAQIGLLDRVERYFVPDSTGDVIAKIAEATSWAVARERA